MSYNLPRVSSLLTGTNSVARAHFLGLLEGSFLSGTSCVMEYIYHVKDIHKVSLVFFYR